jgi:hypothetical protein
LQIITFALSNLTINCSKPETSQCHMQRNIYIILVSYHTDILITYYWIKDKNSLYNLLHCINSLKNQWADILKSLPFTYWLHAFSVEASNLAYDTNIQCSQQREGQRRKIWSESFFLALLKSLNSVNDVYFGCGSINNRLHNVNNILYFIERFLIIHMGQQCIEIKSYNIIGTIWMIKKCYLWSYIQFHYDLRYSHIFRKIKVFSGVHRNNTSLLRCPKIL